MDSYLLELYLENSLYPSMAWLFGYSYAYIGERDCIIEQLIGQEFEKKLGTSREFIL